MITSQSTLIFEAELYNCDYKHKYNDTSLSNLITRLKNDKADLDKCNFNSFYFNSVGLEQNVAFSCYTLEDFIVILSSYFLFLSCLSSFDSKTDLKGIKKNGKKKS